MPPHGCGLSRPATASRRSEWWRSATRTAGPCVSLLESRRPTTACLVALGRSPAGARPADHGTGSRSQPGTRRSGRRNILNGHEYVAAAARATGVRFVKEGNCFTRLADPAALAQIADTLSQPATIGRLTQVCDRWIYTACLCFGLDLAERAAPGSPTATRSTDYPASELIALRSERTARRGGRRLDVVPYLARRTG